MRKHTRDFDSKNTQTGSGDSLPGDLTPAVGLEFPTEAVDELSDPLLSARSLGPGVRLRRAREQMGLTAVDVASRMRLTRHVIEDLERDEYHKGVPKAFLKGYLRTYARLVKLPSDEIVGSFELLFGSRNQEAPVAPTSSESDMSASDSFSQPKSDKADASKEKRLRWISVGLLLAIILIFIAWWRTYTGASPIDSLSQVDLEDLNQDVSLLTENVNNDNNNDFNNSIVSDSAVSFGQVVSHYSDDRLEVLTDDSAVVVDALVRVADSNNSFQDSTDADNLVADFSQPFSSINQIVIEVVDQCWVEVTDAEGKRLYFDLMTPKQLVELTGTAPFEVLLGNPSVAEVRYDGELVNLNDLPNNRTARITVGT